MEKTTALYVRISRDTEGEGLGVARQEQACRELAKQRGWQQVEVYEDNDVSAYSGKVRPAYRRLLDDVQAGRVGRVVAWRMDRLHRDVPELLEFFEVARSARCEIVAVLGGALDVGSASGRFTATVHGAVAQLESAQKSERVRAKLRQNAEAGKHHGGSRPYGWQDDRRALAEDEAAHVRTAVSLLLGGNSMKAIVRALNEASARNTRGGLWQDVSLRSTLLRARNAGLRTHHGEVLDGVPGQWEPILDRDTWEQVRVLLSDPARRTNPGATGRTHLLSGIAGCGICGGPLRAAKGKPYKGVAATIYRCFPAGCVSRNQEQVDDLVRRLVCARLAREDAVDLLRPVGEPDGAGSARAEVERLRGRLDTAAADYADDLMTREQYLTQTKRLRGHLAAAEARVPAPAPRLAVLDTLVGAESVEAAWEALDVSVRRQVVALLLEVVVQPTRRGRGFDPTSVQITWKAAA
ncbi:MAG TPA: recombinase family protein [Mycobacteriales bacterium]|jgi:DNA invertase Pin-like site-specific DNA recombinase|nr:recombinase family protein [Mycobacteriales bacterium]